MFFSNISYAMYIHTYCCYFRSLDHLLKPPVPRIKNDNNCPGKATSTVPVQQSFHILGLSLACSATSNYFHLPPHYEDHSMVMNVSLDTANIDAINILTLNFRIWQHFGRNWTNPTCRSWQMFLKCQLHSSTEIWSMPVNQFTHLPPRMMMRTHPSYGQS